MNNFIYGVCVAAGTDPESGATRLIIKVPAHVLRDAPPMVYHHVRVALNDCLTCMGKGILYTGIMESPTTICHACLGLETNQAAPLGAQLLADFPLFDDTGLSEAEHCCEWTLLQERKRLHAKINKIAPDAIAKPLADALRAEIAGGRP